MTLVVEVAASGVRLPLSQDRVVALARGVLRGERVRDALLSVSFVDAKAIARLNKRHLGRRGTTDVIAFGFARPTPRSPVIGDIYIAPDVARANAASLGVSAREEVARLVVHGTLHVLGYDHPEGDGRTRSAMWRRQERLLGRLRRTAAL
jgi:probable rRNA maturation factor